MKFQGNILITDPCYVVKDNDWDSCDDEYEGILSSHGVDSISAGTGIGDGSWKVYEVPQGEDPNEWVNKIKALYDEFGNHDETYEKIEALLASLQVLGHFCADAGMSCVADIEQLYAYNPEAEEFVKKHNWCCAVIEDFDGEVDDLYLEIPGKYSYDQLIFVGKGNKNFFTF